MAMKRMFARTIVESDAFITMSPSAQALYFHFGMEADDDGFVNSPIKITRMIGASEADYMELVNKRFIYVFPSGVIVIKHWNINNNIREGRKKDTAYPEEMAMLTTKENGSYRLKADACQTVGRQLSDKCQTNDRQMPDSCQTNASVDKNSIDKNSIDKGSIGECMGEKRTVFRPPTLDEVQAYCQERNNTVDADRFLDYYTSNGWFVGKHKMKDWKAAVRTWERNGYSNTTTTSTSKQTKQNKAVDDYNAKMERLAAWANESEGENGE